MLDLQRLSSIRLTTIPPYQKLFGNLLVQPTYKIYPGVEIVFEGYDPQWLEGRSVLFAMNHTDMYNYFPFQIKLWKTHGRFTASWVKGKYFEHPALANFLVKTAQIPVPSRGYVIARDFHSAVGREPTEAEYEIIRRRLDGDAQGDDSNDVAAQLPPELLTTPRSMLGRPFDGKEDYFTALADAFALMMRQFVLLNEEALSKRLNLLVFPQGTRSIRLSRGHIGVAEMAMYLDVPIIPVGCNGTELLYPGNSIFPKQKGKAVYRFGAPIEPRDMNPWRPEGPFEPFNPRDEHLYREKFQGLTDHVMDRINELLDPQYRYSEGLESDGVQGVKRFL